MSSHSSHHLRVCNVKMKNFHRGGNGAHFGGFLTYGALASTDLNFFFMGH